MPSCHKGFVDASEKLHKEQEERLGRRWRSPEEMPCSWLPAACSEQNKSQQAGKGLRKKSHGGTESKHLEAHTSPFIPTLGSSGIGSASKQVIKVGNPWCCISVALSYLDFPKAVQTHWEDLGVWRDCHALQSLNPYAAFTRLCSAALAFLLSQELVGLLRAPGITGLLFSPSPFSSTGQQVPHFGILGAVT